MIRLFATLASSRLEELNLNSCHLGPRVFAALGDYLSQSRSSPLHSLHVMQNDIGLKDIRALIDIVEKDNFTLQVLDVDISSEEGQGGVNMQPTMRNPYGQFSEEEEARFAAAEKEGSRLDAVLSRNIQLCIRVKKAAVQYLPYAQIILNAKPGLADLPLPTSDPSPFRLLDLPRELIRLTIRHICDDPLALSDAQFARLCDEAETKEALGRRLALSGLGEEEAKRKRGTSGLRPVFTPWGNYLVRDSWLKDGRWDRWERNV
jgi:hypothetical protein